MEYKHKVGLYIGRFQPFHKGHKSIAEAALEVMRSCQINVV